MAKKLRLRGPRNGLDGRGHGSEFSVLDLLQVRKYKKYKASRFLYKYERDAMSFINGTKRGKGKNLSQMKSRHSNYEWIWVEPIDG